MSTPVPGVPADRTRVQTEPPAHHTDELSDDRTNPTFGTPAPAGGFAFLSPPQAPDEIGRLGEYRVLARLGEGGMGVVFRAEDSVLKRPVALKVMRPEVACKPQAADRFLREGRAAAALKSDHVITIYQVGRANGVPFLAMELLEGLPVDAWLKRQTKPVPVGHALRVTRDCLRGLAAAHARGLIHRDVKPANLWIDKGTGRVKVLDFGLTRGADGGDQLTVDGAVVGTPAFMAPEQAAGLPVGPPADVFAAGLVLYALLTGRSPFARDSLMATLRAVGADPVPPVRAARPDVPPAVAAALERMLRRDPPGRPADARAALDMLIAAEKEARAQQTTVPAADPAADAPIRLDPAAPPPPTRPARRRFVAAGLFGFLALALAGIVIVITNKDGTKTTIELPDGATVEVRPAAAPPAPAPGKAADPTRAALEQMLGRGWSVYSYATRKTYSHPRDLPPGRLDGFELIEGFTSTPKLTDAEMDLLRPVEGMDVLIIRSPLGPAGAEKLLGFASAGRLQSIGLDAERLTDDVFRVIARLPKVQHVAVSGNPQVTGRGLAALDGKDLISVDLADTGLTDDQLSHLDRHPNLRVLTVTGTLLTDAGIDRLCRQTGLRILRVRRMRHATDAGMAALERLTGLERLACGQPSGPGPTPAMMRSVGRLASLRTLEYDGPPLTDADLDPLLGLPRLEKLLLSPPHHVTDAGLMKLAGLKTLKELKLSGPKLTPAGVAAFRAARPDVTLMYDADKK